MRNSVNVARISRASGGKAAGGFTDVETANPVAAIQQQVDTLENAVAELGPQARGEIQVHLDGVKATAAQLANVTQLAETGKAPK